MFILRVESQIKDFNDWKKLFDSDPASRQKSGVRRYKISQPVDNDNFVMIDFEFDTKDQAEVLLGKLRDVWRNIGSDIMSNQQTRIAQSVEAVEY